MRKKLIAASMAVAAIAVFAAAPAASASPVLTESGTALAKGASITGQSTGNALFTVMSTTFACTSAHFNATVTKNSGTRIALEIPKNTTEEPNKGLSFSSCSQGTWIVKSALCIETIEKDTVVITGCGGNIVFIVPLGIITCEYSAASITGTFMTGTDATINISEQVFKPTSPCGALGALDVVFDLTTTNGTTLSIS